MIKINNKRAVPQANRVFTDREKPRKVFWDTYDTLKLNMDKLNDIAVVTFYGIGGIGKTSLIKQLMNELTEKIPQPKYIYIDFKNVKDTIAVLKSMRNSLQSDYNFQFPMFDLALYVYLKKLGEDIEKGGLKSITSKSPFLSSLMDLCGAIPVIGFVPTVLKSVDNLVAATRNMINDRKLELYELQNEEPDIILKNLPYYFAGDLENNLKDSGEPFVVFFDTYEALVNELSGIGEPLKNDQWIRDEKRGLITNIPNTIWVIAGREKIKWEQFNSEWKDALNQHLLGSLSGNDTESFLCSAGVSDERLRKEIYTLTNGTPVYLDISVDRYYEILENGETPSIDKIGREVDELIERFVRYMDDNKKDLMFLLSCLDEWTDDLLINVAGKVLTGFSYVSVEKIKGYSFISTEDNVDYVMHQTVRDVLYRVCPNSILKRVNEYMEIYLFKELEQLPPSNAGYLKLLKRYLKYKLMNIHTSEDFARFYNDTYIEFYNKLLEGYQYAELCRVHETITEFAGKRFGKTMESARCYMDYSIILVKSGNYRESLSAATISYEYYIELSGEEHPYTIKAMTNLAKMYYKAGIYEEALPLSEKALGLSRKIFGDEHPDTIAAMNGLAIDYSVARRDNEALELAEKVLELRMRILGEKHPDTTIAINNLSIQYSIAGRNDEALELAKKVLELRMEILGEEHPDTIAAMNNLSNKYCVMELDKEAVELAEKALELSVRILGEKHPDTIKVMYTLCSLYHNTQMYEEMVDLSEKILETRIEISGEEHPDMVHAMNILATDYRRKNGRRSGGIGKSTEAGQKNTGRRPPRHHYSHG